MILSMAFQGRSLTASAQVEYVIEKKWSALQAEIVLIWSKTHVWETWSHGFLVTVMYNLNIQTDKSFCDLKSLFNFIKGECALWLVSYIAADSQCFNSQGNPNNCKQLNN